MSKQVSVKFELNTNTFYENGFDIEQDCTFAAIRAVYKWPSGFEKMHVDAVEVLQADPIDEGYSTGGDVCINKTTRKYVDLVDEVDLDEFEPGDWVEIDRLDYYAVKALIDSANTDNILANMEGINQVVYKTASELEEIKDRCNDVDDVDGVDGVDDVLYECARFKLTGSDDKLVFAKNCGVDISGDLIAQEALVLSKNIHECGRFDDFKICSVLAIDEGKIDMINCNETEWEYAENVVSKVVFVKAIMDAANGE